MDYKYTINNQTIVTQKQLTDAEIDEIAAQLGTPAPDQSDAETARLSGKKEVKPPSLLERIGQNFVPGLSNRADITPEGQANKAKEIGRQLGLTARAGITGLSALPAMAADPLGKIANQAMGKQVFPSQYDVIANSLNLPKPANELEEYVQSGAEAMAGIGSQSALAKKMSSRYTEPFTQDLAQQTAVAVPAAIGAQAASNRAEDVGFGEGANFAATLSLGLLAGLAGGKAQRKLSADKTPAVTMDEVKQKAADAYGRVDASGVTIKPLPILKSIDDIESSLVKNENFNPQLDTHRPVKQVLDQMRSMVGTQRSSFTQLDQIRQTASALSRESTDAATRRLASKVVEGIDARITSLQPTDLISGKGKLTDTIGDVKEAREAWRRVSKATVIEDALNIAEARALAPNASEGELIRTQFKALASNKNKMRLFNDKEQEAIRRVVSGSGSEKLLSLAARFSPARNQLVSGLTVGASLTNPTAAMITGGVAGTGLVSDMALGRIQRKATERVLSQILSGKVPQPRSSVAWRGLVEAEIQALQAQNETEENNSNETK